MPAHSEPAREAAFWAGVEHAQKFFMGDADVHHALRKLVSILEQEQIPYAIVGAMALNEYGYRRTTSDVDVLLTAEGLATLKARGSGAAMSRSFPAFAIPRTT